MAGSYNEALSNIRQYATEAQDAQESQMDVDVSSVGARLDSTLKELQDCVKQQQIALDKVLRHITALSSPKAQILTCNVATRRISRRCPHDPIC